MSVCCCWLSMEKHWDRKHSERGSLCSHSSAVAHFKLVEWEKGLARIELRAKTTLFCCYQRRRWESSRRMGIFFFTAMKSIIRLFHSQPKRTQFWKEKEKMYKKSSNWVRKSRKRKRGCVVSSIATAKSVGCCDATTAASFPEKKTFWKCVEARLKGADTIKSRFIDQMHLSWMNGEVNISR